MSLLVTDLDNTLYDWVTYYAKAFGLMAQELSLLLEVDQEALLDEFKTLHQHYGNSEQPFAVLELPSVRQRFGSLSRRELFEALQGPLLAFRRSRSEHLKLYPGVLETLDELRSRGVIVVGHTEATAEQAYFRLRSLGVADRFLHLYALDGKLKPHPDPSRHSELTPPNGFVTYVPRQERKPNPELLQDICRKERVTLGDAYYVGDSLTRDVSMANHAGVIAIWARYGTQYDRSLWDTLVRITHWTDEDVRREEMLKERLQHVEPDYTLDSFTDLLEIVAAN